MVPFSQEEEWGNGRNWKRLNIHENNEKSRMYISTGKARKAHLQHIGTWSPCYQGKHVLFCLSHENEPR